MFLRTGGIGRWLSSQKPLLCNRENYQRPHTKLVLHAYLEPSSKGRKIRRLSGACWPSWRKRFRRRPCLKGTMDEWQRTLDAHFWPLHAHTGTHTHTHTFIACTHTHVHTIPLKHCFFSSSNLKLIKNTQRAFHWCKSCSHGGTSFFL